MLALVVLFVVPLCSLCCSGWSTFCPSRLPTSGTTRSSKQSGRCACCRWCSAGCSGRSPGSGPTKPVLHKMAYGTDRDVHGGRRAPVTREAALVERLARLEGRVPASELKVLRADLEALESEFADTEAR